MQEVVAQVVVIALMACWIGEWSKLVQNIAWWINAGWFDYIFGCAKCWGFWLGLYQFGIGWECIVVSATAMVMNKIYMRL